MLQFLIKMCCVLRFGVVWCVCTCGVCVCVYMWCCVCTCGVVCVHVVLCVYMWCCVCLFLHVSFSFFSSLFSFLFSPLSSLSSSLSAHTETTSTRQMTPPTKNGHAPRDPLNQERELSICQSLLCHNMGSSRVLSQIKPQAPLLVVPFRAMPDFHEFYLRCLGLDPAFLKRTVYRKINGRKPFTKSAAEDDLVAMVFV